LHRLVSVSCGVPAANAMRKGHEEYAGNFATARCSFSEQGGGTTPWI